MIGVEIPRLQLGGFLELHFRRSHFSSAHEIGSQIRSGWPGIRLQTYRFLQVLRGFGILRLRGVHQPQEFVNFKVFWRRAYQILQLGGGFRQMARFIFRRSRLEHLIQAPIPLLLSPEEGGCQEKQASREPVRASHGHGPVC